MTSIGALEGRRSDARTPAAAGPGRTMLALATAGLVVSMQQTLVLPLLPRLTQTFHTSVSAVTWVFTVTLLAGAVATPLLSRFGDMYGKKKMMIITMAVLLVGSMVCAVSGSLAVLIVGRGLQGVSAALIPLAIGTIRDTFPRERITTAIGIVSATMGFGGTVGMLTTGVIADHTASHHPIFWIAAATAAAGLVLVVVCTSPSGGRAGGRPDLPGAVILGGWLVCLLLAISEGNDWGWASGRIVGLFAGAVALCALWVVVELRSRDPLVRLNLLVGRMSLSANVAGLLLGFALFAGFTLIANFVEAPRAQVGYGLSGSVLDVGLYLLPSAVTMLIFSALTGRVEARIGPGYTLAIGAFFVALSYVWLTLHHGSGTDVLVFSATQGLGVGIGYAALGTLAVQHVPMDQSGIASGINTLVRTTGGSVASATTAAVLSAFVIAHTPVPTLHAYMLCFVIGAASAALTAVVATWHGLRHGT
ncbi:MAG TPA: MFS transporter [Streptosporangiaceae bacterium]